MTPKKYTTTRATPERKGTTLSIRVTKAESSLIKRMAKARAITVTMFLVGLIEGEQARECEAREIAPIEGG